MTAPWPVVKRSVKPLPASTCMLSEGSYASDAMLRCAPEGRVGFAVRVAGGCFTPGCPKMSQNVPFGKRLFAIRPLAAGEVRNGTKWHVQKEVICPSVRGLTDKTMENDAGTILPVTTNRTLTD